MSQREVAIGVTLASLLILAASFMTWGEIRGPLEVKTPFGDELPLGDLLRGANIVITVSAWNGHFTLGGMKLPNWLVVLAAGLVVAFCWLNATGAWRAPRWLSMLLALYGLLHAGLFAVVMMVSERGTVGIGSLLTAVGFLAAFVVLLRGSRHPVAVATAQPT